MINIHDVVFLSGLILILLYLIKPKSTNKSVIQIKPSQPRELIKYNEIRKPVYPYHIDTLILYIERALKEIKRPFHIITYNGVDDTLTLGIFRTDIVTSKSLRKVLKKYDIHFLTSKGTGLNDGLVYKFIYNNTKVIITVVYQTGHGAWFRMFSDIRDSYIVNTSNYKLVYYRYEHVYGISNLLVLSDD